MTQPIFPDGPPVPLLVDGLMDESTMRQLFADLASSATVLCVREKSSQTGFANPEELPLNIALERLLAGASRATQLRYRYDGHEWSDTILALPQGFRVIRCRHEVVV